MSEAGRYVLDTSAVLGLRGDEPGADRVENLLRMAARGRTQVLLSFMTRMELLYRVGRDEGAEVAAAAIRLLDATAIRWISCDDDVLEEASRIKAGSGISVADAWIAATAALRSAVLVHKDPEFLRLKHVVQERLDQ